MCSTSCMEPITVVPTETHPVQGKRPARHEARDKSSSFPVLTVRLLPWLGEINGPERYFSLPICCHQSFCMLLVALKSNLSLFGYLVCFFLSNKGQREKFCHTERLLAHTMSENKSNDDSKEDANPVLVRTTTRGSGMKRKTTQRRQITYCCEGTRWNQCLCLNYGVFAWFCTIHFWN